MKDTKELENYIKILCKGKISKSIPYLIALYKKDCYPHIIPTIRNELPSFGDILIPYLEDILNREYEPLKTIDKDLTKPELTELIILLEVHYLIKFLAKTDNEIVKKNNNLISELSLLFRILCNSDALRNKKIEHFQKTISNGNLLIQRQLHDLSSKEVLGELMFSLPSLRKEIHYIRNSHIIIFDELLDAFKLFYHEDEFKEIDDLKDIFDIYIKGTKALGMNLSNEEMMFFSVLRNLIMLRGLLSWTLSIIYVLLLLIIFAPLVIKYLIHNRNKSTGDTHNDLFPFNRLKNLTKKFKDICEWEEHNDSSDEKVRNSLKKNGLYDNFYSQMNNVSSQFLDILVSDLNLSTRLVKVKNIIHSTRDFFFVLEILKQIESKKSLIFICKLYNRNINDITNEHKDIYISIILGELLTNDLREFELLELKEAEIQLDFNDLKENYRGYGWYDSNNLSSSYNYIDTKIRNDVYQAIDELFVNGKSFILNLNLELHLKNISIKFLLPSLIHHIKNNHKNDAYSEYFYHNLIRNLGFHINDYNNNFSDLCSYVKSEPLTKPLSEFCKTNNSKKHKLFGITDDKNSFDFFFNAFPYVNVFLVLIFLESNIIKVFVDTFFYSLIIYGACMLTILGYDDYNKYSRKFIFYLFPVSEIIYILASHKLIFTIIFMFFIFSINVLIFLNSGLAYYITGGVIVVILLLFLPFLIYTLLFRKNVINSTNPISKMFSPYIKSNDYKIPTKYD